MQFSYFHLIACFTIYVCCLDDCLFISLLICRSLVLMLNCSVMSITLLSVCPYQSLLFSILFFLFSLISFIFRICIHSPRARVVNIFSFIVLTLATHFIIKRFLANTLMDALLCCAQTRAFVFQQTVRLTFKTKEC